MWCTISNKGTTIGIGAGSQIHYDPTTSAQLQTLNTGQSALTDNFTYTASDGFGGQNTAGVTVTVAGVTDQKPPAAVDAVLHAPEAGLGR
jgi:hypothetical protein